MTDDTEPEGRLIQGHFGGVEPSSQGSTRLLPEEIRRFLAPLDELEQKVLSSRFGVDQGEPRTLEEVAEHLNLGRDEVRWIERRAMDKLRGPRDSSDLLDDEPEE